MKRVIWDETEVVQLAEQVAKLRIDDPTEGILALITKAQKQIFPPERQRKILTVRNCGEDFVKLLKHALKQHAPVLGTPPKTVIEYVQPDEAEVLLNCATTQLITELVSRMLTAIEGLAKPAVGIERILATVEPPKRAPVLARIGVAGMDAAHFRALQNRVGASVELRYVNQERPQAPSTLDHVVVVGSAKRYWKDFVSPKVKVCDAVSLGDVTAYVKQLVPTAPVGPEARA